MREVPIRLDIKRLPEGVWLATSPDVPGLLAQGDTMAEAMQLAAELATTLYEVSIDHGDPVPEVYADQDSPKKLRTHVPILIPDGQGMPPSTALLPEAVLRIVVEWQPEGIYLATSPDLPELTVEAETVAEALQLARENAYLLLDTLQELGRLPETVRPISHDAPQPQTFAVPVFLPS